MIQRAVMSFWTAPCKAKLYSPWQSVSDNQLAWQISSGLLRKYFTELVLVTDELGWKYLKPLRLPFTDVMIDLDNVDIRLARNWSMGKIRAYTLQKVPFVHVDIDAFLFEPLPDLILNAELCVQFPKYFDKNDQVYKLKEMCRLNIPEVVREVANESKQYAANCGLFGANNLEAVKVYTDLVNECLSMDPNGWNNISGYDGLILLEEWMLGVVSKITGCKIDHLYSSCGDYLRKYNSGKAGFVHLWGSNKNDKLKFQNVVTRWNQISE